MPPVAVPVDLAVAVAAAAVAIAVVVVVTAMAAVEDPGGRANIGELNLAFPWGFGSSRFVWGRGGGWRIGVAPRLGWTKGRT